MTEVKAIELLLDLIEDHFDSGKRAEWRTSHFNLLSQHIKEKTSVLISPRTLIRFFRERKSIDGKPQISTLNTFSQYVDYKDWEDFKHKNKVDDKENHENTIVKSKYNWADIIFVVGVLVLTIITVIFSIPSNKEQKEVVKEDYFSIESDSGVAPFNSSLKIKMRIKETDSVFFMTSMSNRKTLLTKYDSVCNTTFFMPGIYEVRVVNAKNDVLYSKKLKVFSDNWESCVAYDYNYGLLIPFSNKIVSPVDGNMYIDQMEVERRKVEMNKVYWVKYYNYKNFHLDGDNFGITTAIKNCAKDGGVSCYDARLSIEGEHGSIMISLVDKGCYSHAKVYISEKTYIGNSTDLSMFGRKMDDWGRVNIYNNNKVVDVYLDNKKIYTDRYEKSIGTVYGISYFFKGNGRVDDIQLKDKAGQIIIDEKFD